MITNLQREVEVQLRQRQREENVMVVGQQLKKKVLFPSPTVRQSEARFASGTI